ncbi:ATP-binding protein [Paenalcaligenes hominis]|uniref:ATP-binding protein n=1 Tax=Paenalcaligenes hominis TaxID=643674 RepID=UPI0035269083
MRTAEQIHELLSLLDTTIADELEDQDLDFKLWDKSSRDKSVKTAVQMAVCMANGGGGTVVFGVADRVVGRANAIVGVPLEIDSNILKKAVYDQTDPRIIPLFEELRVPEGTGRLLIMQINPGMPPHTDTAGRGTIRVAKDCVPLTGGMRRKIAVETGETDYSAEPVAPVHTSLLSPSALETLRTQARKEKAAEDLLHADDITLLDSLHLIKNNQFTRAALLLAGNEQAIRDYLPGYNWTFLQMRGDTEYGVREDRISALPIAIQRIEELITPFNQITTYKQGMFHFEYHTWPHIAVREALMNAFCHADYRISGPIIVKLYADRLEFSNNGGFIAGITPSNILHHQPAARNPLLVEALTRLRLVNRSNLGISRMFSSLLVEGKEAPIISEVGDSVQVVFLKRELNPTFRMFVAEENEKGKMLAVDELILLQHLLQHNEVDTSTAAVLCQRSEGEIKLKLATMAKDGYLEQGGHGRGTYWSIHPNLHRKLVDDGNSETRRRITWEAAKTRVLSMLMERAKRGEAGISNREIRQVTKFSRNHVLRLIKELQAENPDQIVKQGSAAKTTYVWHEK